MRLEKKDIENLGVARRFMKKILHHFLINEKLLVRKPVP